MATAIAAAPLVSLMARAQTPPGGKTKEATAPPNPQPSPTPQKPSPVAEAYVEVVRARFGDQLTPEQSEQVKKDLAGVVGVTDAFSKVKLNNGDEPDFTFIA
jgi:hypothetical protein